jgi:hypothetical protein
MTRMGFKPTIPVFDPAKTVHVLGSTAIVTSKTKYTDVK